MDNEELKKLFDAVLSDKLKLLAKEYGFRSGKLALKKKNSDKNIELSLIYSKKVWAITSLLRLLIVS